MKNKYFIFFVVMFSVAMIYVFSQVFSPWTVIASPDDAPYYSQNFHVMQADSALSGNGPFHPLNSLHVFNPITVHELRYIIALFLFALSVAYYLRSLKIHPLPAYGAGLLASVSGYSFTLFCAGHLGFYWLLATFFWSLGLVNVALEKGSLRHFVLLGAVVMWGQAYSPDVWMLCAMLLGCYMLYRLWWFRKSPLVINRLAKFLITATIAVCIGLQGMHIALTQHLAGRDKQIAESSRTTGSGQATPEEKKQQAEDRWIFATNWSLPLADCAELVIPGFFGDNAMTPPYPYWGALGRPYHFQKGKMMPNYRQHTTYLGLVTVFLAIVGVFAWFINTKREKVGGRREEGESQQSELSSQQETDYRDVPFWAGVWVICLILALGRYTPIYRFFYSIPYMDYLRAPVKFLHFTELAGGLLAGFGMQALMTQRFSEKDLKRLVFIGVGFILLLVVVVLGVSINSASIEKHIAELGLGTLGPVLRGYTSYNCLRAIGIMVAVLALIYVGWLQKPHAKKISLVLCALVGVGVFDLAAVARRFVVPMNVRAHHEENAIIKDMKRVTQGRPALTVNYLTRNVNIQDWLSTSLSINGLMTVLPDETDPNSKVRPLAVALQKDPIRYWDFTGPRFVLLSRQQAEQVVQMQLAKPIAQYEMGQGFVRRSASSSEQSVVLLERTKQPIYPCVFFNWTGGIKPDDQINQLIKGAASTAPLTSHALLASDAPSPSGLSAMPIQSVSFSQMRGEKNVFVSRATVQLPQAGLLVWNERYSSDLVAFVDKNEVPLYQANGQWCAVQVQAGTHTVTCKTRVKGYMSFLSIATSLMVILACGICVVRSKRD